MIRAVVVPKQPSNEKMEIKRLVELMQLPLANPLLLGDLNPESPFEFESNPFLQALKNQKDLKIVEKYTKKPDKKILNELVSNFSAPAVTRKRLAQLCDKFKKGEFEATIKLHCGATLPFATLLAGIRFYLLFVLSAFNAI